MSMKVEKDKYSRKYLKNQERKINNFLNTNVLKIHNIETLSSEELYNIERQASILENELSNDKITYFTYIETERLTEEAKKFKQINNNQIMELICLKNSIKKELARRVNKVNSDNKINIISNIEIKNIEIPYNKVQYYGTESKTNRKTINYEYNISNSCFSKRKRI